MKFYIITPAWNALRWLPCAVRSVRDQACPGIEVHHHVQDGGSTDGSREWLETWQREHGNEPDYRFSFESAPDRGMYDAINRAWALIPEDADYTAHLNSDEQYLPLALREVAAQGAAKPRADILLGSYLILDEHWEYICHRRPVLPRRWSSWLNCACITNSSFYRGDFFRRLRPRYDTQWKSIGDLVFFRRLTEQDVRFATIPVLTSAFLCTGSNLAWTETGQREWQRLRDETPLFWRSLNGLIYRWVNAKRRLADLFLPSPRAYSVYTDASDERRDFTIARPTVRWRAATRKSADARAEE